MVLKLLKKIHYEHHATFLMISGLPYKAKELNVHNRKINVLYGKNYKKK